MATASRRHRWQAGERERCQTSDSLAAPRRVHLHDQQEDEPVRHRFHKASAPEGARSSVHCDSGRSPEDAAARTKSKLSGTTTAQRNPTHPFSTWWSSPGKRRRPMIYAPALEKLAVRRWRRRRCVNSPPLSGTLLGLAISTVMLPLVCLVIPTVQIAHNSSQLLAQFDNKHVAEITQGTIVTRNTSQPVDYTDLGLLSDYDDGGGDVIVLQQTNNKSADNNEDADNDRKSSSDIHVVPTLARGEGAGQTEFRVAANNEVEGPSSRGPLSSEQPFATSSECDGNCNLNSGRIRAANQVVEEECDQETADGNKSDTNNSPDNSNKSYGATADAAADEDDEDDYNDYGTYIIYESVNASLRPTTTSANSNSNWMPDSAAEMSGTVSLVPAPTSDAYQVIFFAAKSLRSNRKHQQHANEQELPSGIVVDHDEEEKEESSVSGGHNNPANGRISLQASGNYQGVEGASQFNELGNDLKNRARREESLDLFDEDVRWLNKMKAASFSSPPTPQAAPASDPSASTLPEPPADRPDWTAADNSSKEARESEATDHKYRQWRSHMEQANSTGDDGEGDHNGNMKAHNVYYWRLIWLVLPLGATFGNLLVIMAVYMERSLQSVTNYFIVSLAFADLFVGLVVMPFAVYVLVNEVWELSDAICDMFVAVDVTSSTASILNLVAISIDRYLAIAHPIAYSAGSSGTRAISTIFCVWLISCCVGAPIILGLNTSPDRDSSLCILYNSTFIFWSSLTSFYVPCIIMIGLYWRIFSAIRSRTKKAIQGHQRQYHHNSKQVVNTVGSNQTSTGNQKRSQSPPERRQRLYNGATPISPVAGEKTSTAPSHGRRDLKPINLESLSIVPQTNTQTTTTTTTTKTTTTNIAAAGPNNDTQNSAGSDVNHQAHLGRNGGGERRQSYGSTSSQNQSIKCARRVKGEIIAVLPAQAPSNPGVGSNTADSLASSAVTALAVGAPKSCVQGSSPSARRKSRCRLAEANLTAESDCAHDKASSALLATLMHTGEGAISGQPLAADSIEQQDEEQGLDKAKIIIDDGQQRPDDRSDVESLGYKQSNRISANATGQSNWKHSRHRRLLVELNLLGWCDCSGQDRATRSSLNRNCCPSKFIARLRSLLPSSAGDDINQLLLTQLCCSLALLYGTNDNSARRKHFVENANYLAHQHKVAGELCGIALDLTLASGPEMPQVICKRLTSACQEDSATPRLTFDVPDKLRIILEELLWAIKSMLLLPKCARNAREFREEAPKNTCLCCGQAQQSPLLTSIEPDTELVCLVESKGSRVIRHSPGLCKIYEITAISIAASQQAAGRQPQAEMGLFESYVTAILEASDSTDGLQTHLLHLKLRAALMEAQYEGRVDWRLVGANSTLCTDCQRECLLASVNCAPVDKCNGDDLDLSSSGTDPPMSTETRSSSSSALSRSSSISSCHSLSGQLNGYGATSGAHCATCVKIFQQQQEQASPGGRLAPSGADERKLSAISMDPRSIESTSCNTTTAHCTHYVHASSGHLLTRPSISSLDCQRECSVTSSANLICTARTGECIGILECECATLGANSLASSPMRHQLALSDTNGAATGPTASSICGCSPTTCGKTQQRDDATSYLGETSQMGEAALEDSCAAPGEQPQSELVKIAAAEMSDRTPHESFVSTTAVSAIQSATKKIKRRSMRLRQLIRGGSISCDGSSSKRDRLPASQRENTNSKVCRFSSHLMSDEEAYSSSASPVNAGTGVSSLHVPSPGSHDQGAATSASNSGASSSFAILSRQSEPGAEPNGQHPAGQHIVVAMENSVKPPPLEGASMVGSPKSKRGRLLASVFTSIDRMNMSKSSSKPHECTNTIAGHPAVEQKRQDSSGEQKKGAASIGRTTNAVNLTRHRNAGAGGSRRRREKNAARRERKATKTLAIVLGIFLICWTPFFTCNIIDGICIQLDIDCRPGMMVYLVTSWLGYINSCVNPIIYTIFNMEFRRAFKKILTTKPSCF